MTAASVSEQQISEALRALSSDRWAEVLAYINSLQAQETQILSPILTAADLAHSPLLGVWAKRTDLGNRHELARRLREQAERRGVIADAAGH
jgi:hypothetical protein